MVQLAENLVRNVFAIVLDALMIWTCFGTPAVVDSIFVKACAPATMFSVMFLEQDEELPSRGINRWKNPGMATRCP